MYAKNNRKPNGFSLIELVIVVVIIGIIAAIAIPRLSRGAAGASDSSLSGNLAVLRNAIDLYAAEHNGTYPLAATFDDQMTKFTDASGTASATKTSTAIYGPYLRKVPVQSIGPKKGSNGVAAADATGIGWLYVEGTGVITANATTETDASGKLYLNY
jgi:prepilin-type N-terminal cleavage/methylation domain-containing protein